MKLACVQLTTGRDPAANLPDICARIRQAHQAGADCVALPETCNFMEKGRKAMLARLCAEADMEALQVLCALAEELNIWLLAGSMIVAAESHEVGVPEATPKAANRSFLIAPTGKIAARYDKIHMFDVTLANGETHRESDNYRPGTQAVCADMGQARLGMSVCYDLRFPALYRRLAEAGADILAVPSAFTVPTGAAHWHVLLRARAIETGCFVIAPAQVGAHENGRSTYGHSLIVDPWGRVLAEAADSDSFIIADIDLAQVSVARSQIAALAHGRSFTLPDGGEAAD